MKLCVMNFLVCYQESAEFQVVSEKLKQHSEDASKMSAHKSLGTCIVYKQWFDMSLPCL